MPHVLGVAAFQVGNPVAVIVLMKSDDGPFDFHYRRPSLSCGFYLPAVK